MARVTVEDCIIRLPNRFELVLIAAQRSRDLAGGAEPTVERENDKNPVIALREIADETVDVEELRESLVSGLQKHVKVDEPEDESMEMLAAARQEWAGIVGEAEGEKATEPGKAPGDADAVAAGAEGDKATEPGKAPGDADAVEAGAEGADEDGGQDVEQAGSAAPGEDEGEENPEKDGP